MHLINKYKIKEKLFTLIEVQQKNIKVNFMDYGATILNIFVPDKDGKMETVLMAYDKLPSYIENVMYLNATVGPTSGRIKNGKFTINDTEYNLDLNHQGTDNLHAGKDGISFQCFKYIVTELENATEVLFSYVRKEAGSNYPGNQIIQIVYTVKEGEVLVEFIANTDKDTIMNLTNHAYFNLSGNMKSLILDNELQIHASKTLRIDENFIPVEVIPVTDTHLDFRVKNTVKSHFYPGIEDSPARGIDNPLLLDKIDFNSPSAVLYDPVSKRKLSVHTTYPCIVCYTHNYPDYKDLLFKTKQTKHQGICFETQYAPNGINIPNIESGILLKGDKYYHKTLFKFSVEEG